MCIKTIMIAWELKSFLGGKAVVTQDMHYYRTMQYIQYVYAYLYSLLVIRTIIIRNCWAIGCITISTQRCSDSHIVLSIVEQHQLNTGASGEAHAHCLWNSGNAVGLTTELRPLQSDCDIVVSKVNHIRPNNLRSIGKVCICNNINFNNIMIRIII